MPLSPALPSALLATSTTGTSWLRSHRPISSSSGVSPARLSMTNSAASAPFSETCVCARIRPGKVAASSSSQPAVSTASNVSPARPASPMRRSRVTPGWSSTSASRFPTSRLNSVDLPTLGRPMMTTWGSFCAGMMRRQVALCAGVGKGGLPASRICHARPRFLRVEIAVLQQLHGYPVGRAHEGHVPVARRAIDGDA